jgi:hypothetical protein
MYILASYPDLMVPFLQMKLAEVPGAMEAIQQLFHQGQRARVSNCNLIRPSIIYAHP